MKLLVILVAEKGDDKMESGLGALAGLGAEPRNKEIEIPVSKETEAVSLSLILFGVGVYLLVAYKDRKRVKEKATKRMEESRRYDPSMFEKYHLPLSRMRGEEPWEQFKEKYD